MQATDERAGPKSMQGTFGHGHGDGLGHGFLRRSHQDAGERGRGYKPPKRGCGIEALTLLAIAVATPLFCRFT